MSGRHGSCGSRAFHVDPLFHVEPVQRPDQFHVKRRARRDAE
jgi:hypothetical protein